MPAATIDELSVADDPGRWSELGFDVDGDGCRLGDVLVRFAGAGEGNGIVAWSLRDLRDTGLDGLPTSASDAPPRESAPAQANGVVAIDHVVAVSPSLQRSIAALEGAGLDLRRVREEPTPAGAPRQAFFRLGRTILEVVQEPEDVVARDGGPDRPARFWGLALLVEDLDGTVARFAPHVGTARPAVQPGRRIATVKRSAGLSLPLALMSGAEDDGGGR
jgi:hypothetical protein